MTTVCWKAWCVLLALTGPGGTGADSCPWVAECMQEKVSDKNDHHTTVMAPIAAGQQPLCENAPDGPAILRALPRVARGVPFVYDEYRDDITFAMEKLVDRIDPPRFYPLIGSAQLHHCHWKCTVYYTETIEAAYPFPWRCARPRVAVVYMDRDHLHLVACTPEEAGSLSPGSRRHFAAAGHLDATVHLCENMFRLIVCQPGHLAHIQERQPEYVEPGQGVRGD
jgi:hypothetical protein